MFLVIMPRVSAILRCFDNLETFRQPIFAATKFGSPIIDANVNYRSCYLPATRTTTAEISFTSTNASKNSARQIRKMDDVVGNLRDFASEFFSRSQV